MDGGVAPTRTTTLGYAAAKELAYAVNHHHKHHRGAPRWYATLVRLGTGSPAVYYVKVCRLLPPSVWYYLPDEAEWRRLSHGGA